MWYRDLDGTAESSIAKIAAFFDCSEAAATEIFTRAHASNSLGVEGKPFGTKTEEYDLTVADDYKLLRQIKKWLNTPHAVDRFGGCDTSDLAQLFLDAWKDGIQLKARVTVKLDNSTCDAGCTDCGESLPNGSTKCGKCGCTEVYQSVTVTVSDTYAELWADNDQYIDGSTWETAASEMVYAILTTRKGLAAELMAEGYKLDLSDYTESEHQ